MPEHDLTGKHESQNERRLLRRWGLLGIGVAPGLRRTPVVTATAVLTDRITLGHARGGSHHVRPARN
jgi:hypothetical protein